MSSIDKVISFGQILKPHGIKGELKVLFYNEHSNSLKKNQIVFLRDLNNEIFEYNVHDILFENGKIKRINVYKRAKAQEEADFSY